MRYQKLPEYVDAAQIKGDSYIAGAPMWFVKAAMQGRIYFSKWLGSNTSENFPTVICASGAIAKCGESDWIVMGEGNKLNVYTDVEFQSTFMPAIKGL
jgi:hypothetical protein